MQATTATTDQQQHQQQLQDNPAHLAATSPASPVIAVHHKLRQNLLDNTKNHFKIQTRLNNVFLQPPFGGTFKTLLIINHAIKQKILCFLYMLLLRQDI